MLVAPMNTLVMRIAQVLLLTLSILAGAASASKADIPKTPTQSPYVAPAGKALLVFVRERKRLAEDVIYSIMNERGQCIAVVGNDWTVATVANPGTQMLMVVTGVAQPQVQLLKVKAEEGRTYVVKLRPRVHTRRPVEITVVRRSSEPLNMFPASLREASPFKPNLEECTAWVDKRQAKLATKAAQAKEAWNAANKEQRASQTIRRADGWTGDEVTGP